MLSILLIHNGCEDHFPVRTGFDTRFYPNDSGLVIAFINRNSEYVYLDGSIEIEGGKLEIIVEDPSGNQLMDTLLPDGSSIVGEKFAANPGYWKLKYKSQDASGKMNIHIHFE